MSILDSVSNLDRLRQITQVLARHGLGELLARTELAGLVPFRKPEQLVPRIVMAERIRLALSDLGPSFVKLGQILSTRPDLLPADVVAELKKLQEDVPPISFADVKQVVEETMGRELSAVYESFDEVPIASASIGQVHKARLKTEAGVVGVAVKVQRPHIRETIVRDLDLLYLMARLVERASPESSIYAPSKLVAEFERSIMAELDYTIEGGNAARFIRNFQSNVLVRFPRVHPEVSGRRVLVAEFFDGLKISEAVAAGFPGDQIAKNAVRVIAQMIFVDGLFHADPHPGNIRILGTPEAPVLGLLDLGMVGSLTSEMRDKAVDLVLAAIQKDMDALADALIAMGRPRDKVDREAFRALVVQVSDKHLGKPLKEVELSALIRDLVQGAVEFQIEMPPEMLMVGKSLMTVEGIGKMLYPDLDVMEEARPFFMQLVWQRFSPQKLGSRMMKMANRLGGAAVDLPPMLAEVLDDMRRGRFRLRTEDTGLSNAAERLGRRLSLGLLGASCIGAGTAVFLAGHVQAAALFFGLASLFALGSWGRLPTTARRKKDDRAARPKPLGP